MGNGLCIGIFPGNKKSDFLGNELTVIDNFPAKEANIPPNFDTNNDLIAIANGDLTTNADQCSDNMLSSSAP